MPASFRMLLSRGRSGGGALLCLLSGLLPCAGFGDGALLGLLGSGRLLSCRRFRRCTLLRLLSCGGFGGGALLSLSGSGSLLSCRRFGCCALLRVSLSWSFSSGALLGLLPSDSFSSRTLLCCMIGRQ